MSSRRWRIATLTAIAGLGLLLLACGGSGRPQRVPKASPAAARPSVSPVERQVAGLRQHLIQHPDDSARRLELANRLYDLGRNAEAVDQYALYLNAHPDDAGVRTDMGTCYKRLGNLERALVEYETVLAKQGEHPMALYNAGIVTELMGRVDLARGYFERAAEADPGGRVGPHARARLQELAAAAGAGASAPSSQQ
jgi:Flp pilus assembly protein TadD